jgi:CheY-like chemotaxis protein
MAELHEPRRGDPVVLVAHESETIREAIRRLCCEAGYQVLAVAGGYGVRVAIKSRVDALVLDVALPEVHAYQLVEEIKRGSPTLRILLVASIYNRTGYKRRPTSLYGADDYVEQHHIPDALLGKLARLIGTAPSGAAPSPPISPPSKDPKAPPLGPRGKTGGPEASKEDGGAGGAAGAPPQDGGAGGAVSLERIKAAGEARLGPIGVRPDAIERARRLAWLIVSDIALYNGDALDVAARHDDAMELEARLRLDLEEGRLLFDLRVSEEVRRQRDFISEALQEIRQQRRTKGRQ